MKKSTRISLLAICFIIFVSTINIFGNYVYAEDGNSQTIYYLNDKGIINGTLFTNEDMMWPGRKISKEFYVANDNNFKCYIKNISIDGELKNKVGEVLNDNDPQYNNFTKNSHMILYCDGKKILEGNMGKLLEANISENEDISIDKNSKRKFSIEIGLDEVADNSTMDLQYNFNIKTNFISVENNAVGGSLVQTGYFFDTKTLIIIGIVLCLSGVVVGFKKRAIH